MRRLQSDLRSAIAGGERVRAAYDRDADRSEGTQSDPVSSRSIDELERCAAEWDAYLAKRAGRLRKMLINRPPIPAASTCTVAWGAARAF
jgi:hypothetical protein